MESVPTVVASHVGLRALVHPNLGGDKLKIFVSGVAVLGVCRGSNRGWTSVGRCLFKVNMGNLPVD